MNACSILVIFLVAGSLCVAEGYMRDFREDIFDQMDARDLPDEDMFVSRRREDPMMDADSRMDAKESDSEAVSFVSNLTPGLQAIIDKKVKMKLPANYHNKTTYIIRHNNKTVEVNVTIDKVTNSRTGFSTISIVESANDTSVDQCTDSSSCQKGLYCRESIAGNFCHKCKNIQSSCDSDAECCGTGTRGALCVHGRCQTGYKKGQAGTLCKVQGDCNQGLCCAQKFQPIKQVSVCKALARLGERCTEGGSQLNLIMDGGLCPCENGLQCLQSDPFMRGIFGSSRDDPLGDTRCSSMRKKTKENWLSGFFNDFDDEEEFGF